MTTSRLSVRSSSNKSFSISIHADADNPVCPVVFIANFNLLKSENVQSKEAVDVENLIFEGANHKIQLAGIYTAPSSTCQSKHSNRDCRPARPTVRVNS